MIDRPGAPQRAPLPHWLLAFCVSFAIVLLAGQAASALPDWALGVRAADLRTHFVDRFFAFDALWYARISHDWYVWDPTRPTQYQDVAFFPLWPAVLWLIGKIGLPVILQRWLTVAVTASLAAASVHLFQRLADRILPTRAAMTAIWLFALYPAANFALQSYPTGLMNLLALAALLAALERRFLAAAFACGLVTAAGPLGLGTALAIWSWVAAASWRALRTTGATPVRVARALAWLGLLGVLSISGLLAFLALQAIKFGEPFAFMHAQRAWEAPMAMLPRVLPTIAQWLVLPDFYEALHGLKHIASPHRLGWFAATIQRSFYELAQGLATLAILAAARLRCWPVFLQGVLTMTLFIWFHGVPQPGDSTLRLLYCAMSIFLGAAWLLRDRPRMSWAAIILSGCLLAGGAFLTVAGYRVT